MLEAGVGGGGGRLDELQMSFVARHHCRKGSSLTPRELDAFLTMLYQLHGLLRKELRSIVRRNVTKCSHGTLKYVAPKYGI
jgi:hypothetical protein